MMGIKLNSLIMSELIFILVVSKKHVCVILFRQPAKWKKGMPCVCNNCPEEDKYGVSCCNFDNGKCPYERNHGVEDLITPLPGDVLCLYVCLYVCMYVCMNVYMLHVYMYALIHVCMDTCMYVSCMHVYMYM